MKKDIYIIKNTINNMCYIGQSNDYLYRFRKHKEEAKRGDIKYKDCLHNAMKELGIDNFYIEILEKNVDNPDEKEKEYIQKLNTIYPNGYNIVSGGIRYPNLSGINHHDATIKSTEELNQIINEIKNTTKSYVEIAKEHNLNFTTIWNISQGNSYKQKDIEYPLRISTLTKEKLDRLTYDLKYSNYSYDELGILYNLSKDQIKAINYGFSWRREYITYPLRQECFIGNEEIYNAIQKDLLSTTISFDELAKKYSCSVSTIRRINNGGTFYNEDYIYPLRQLGKLSSEDIYNIHKLLCDDGISINEIANKYNVTNSTIKRINSGKTKKYYDERFNYPIRK